MQSVQRLCDLERCGMAPSHSKSIHSEPVLSQGPETIAYYREIGCTRSPYMLRNYEVVLHQPTEELSQIKHSGEPLWSRIAVVAKSPSDSLDHCATVLPCTLPHTARYVVQNCILCLRIGTLLP